MTVNRMIANQYVVRDTGQLKTEVLVWDRFIDALYSSRLESAKLLYEAVSNPYFSSLLAFLNYDFPLTRSTIKSLNRMGADFSECLDPAESSRSLRNFFERKIRYWELRPMPQDVGAVVSPADSKVVVGSLERDSHLFLKGKFFSLNELLGDTPTGWSDCFEKGSFAIFRLTPEKYHYNHTPVAGKALDFYEMDGKYNPCNPSATVRLVDPYSKNKRVVTIIDTDVPGGTRVGLVAMIEIVALMIGKIDQRYSKVRYDNPGDIQPGMFLEKGAPKSLFRPGSSTDVLIFQKGRVRFADDLIKNQSREDATSRFSRGFGQPLVETEVDVRSPIAYQEPYQ